MFSLIGPKRFDAPWRDIEAQGWIAPADCIEVRVTLTDGRTHGVRDGGSPRSGTSSAATARTKLPVVRSILGRHVGSQILVIGAYLDQLDELARGPRRTRSSRGPRQEPGTGAAVRAFRTGEIPCWWCRRSPTSRSISPRPPIAVQVSGTFGSRQEEAQRLGRLLRPKAEGGRPTSTRWCPATRSMPITPPIGGAPGRTGLRLPHHRCRRSARPRDRVIPARRPAISRWDCRSRTRAATAGRRSRRRRSRERLSTRPSRAP